MQLLMKLVSFKRPISQTQEKTFLPYGVHRLPLTWGQEATRLHPNTIKYNIGKISLTVWSLFQCQCYRYNTMFQLEEGIQTECQGPSQAQEIKKGGWSNG